MVQTTSRSSVVEGDEETAVPSPSSSTETSPLLIPNNIDQRTPTHRSSLKRRIRTLPVATTITTTLAALLSVFFFSILIYLVVTKHPAHNKNNNNNNNGHQNLSDHLITAKNGAVASDVEVCSTIGVDILKLKNGTAVDAAIATALCIGVVNMYASGIGGGGFMVIRHQNGSSKTVNFREMAPGAAWKDMYNSDPMLAQRGGLAVGIPGEIDGYWKAWKMYGRVRWEDLFEPSIRLCEEGVRVTRYLARRIDVEKGWLRSADKREWGFLFRKGTDEFLKEGEVMYRPALGKTLRVIAEKGLDGFYKGGVAKSLVKFVREKGGILTLEDLEAYESDVEETAKAWAFGREILTCKAPCSGPVLIEGLNIAEGLDMSNDRSGLVTHRIIETMKWLSAGRTELGDPFDSDVSNVARVAEIQSKQFAAMVRRNISDTRTYGWKHYNPSYEFKEDHGTSHMSALDSDGMAVALTTTVNVYFGARICDPETGIVLNNQMDDFSIPGTDNYFQLQPSIYNFVKPYKRPLSSMAPTITVYNGYPSLIIGGSGGSRIVTGVFLSFIKIYQWGYSLLDTIHTPRVHHQLMPEVAFVEKGIREDIIQGLEARGHKIERLGLIGSVIQAIHKLPDGEIHAVSDFWRKGGVSFESSFLTSNISVPCALYFSFALFFSLFYWLSLFFIYFMFLFYLPSGEFEYSWTFQVDGRGVVRGMQVRFIACGYAKLRC
ncbi:hypothetical protein TWF225_007977 [Orbilia oligospora]|nr:hypothetical protein TWF225_007977 [Orbilia oligospora]KAF3247470.1 hypothetical protein TWF217_009628 [Orbilia oligospora]